MSTFHSMFNMTSTTNGDQAWKSVGSPLLDFFSGVCRKDNSLDDATLTRIIELMPKCWAEDPLLTLKMLFYKRDCREGAGERKIFEIGFRYLLDNHPQHAIANIKHIPEYGSWKDIAKLLDHSAASGPAVDLFTDMLREDMTKLSNVDSDNHPNISLAAKWAPTLGGSVDRATGASRSIARALGMGHNWQQKYRRALHSLREYTQVVECIMSAGDWDKIDYQKVPSLAMQRYRKVFERHSADKWKAYLEKLKGKTAKVNATQLMPHQIIRGDLNDELTQHQWNAVVADVRARGTLKNAIAMCDVSGSMTGLPMDVSIALGCLISEVSETNRDLLISFNEQPRFFDLAGMTLRDRVSRIRREVGYNTDLFAAFREIVDRAKRLKLTPDQLPEKIILISDMQFDEADSKYGSSSYECVKKLYADAGYRVPQVVFWNVQGLSTAFPVTDGQTGVCMVSGFSQNILNSVLRGDITDPHDIMLQTLNADRYNRITLANLG